MLRSLLPLAAISALSLTACEDPSEEEGIGYVLVEIESIDDLDTFFGEYGPAASLTVGAYGGAAITATDSAERLAGSSPDGWTVFLTFDSPAQAQAWYDDEDYVAAREHRLDATGYTQLSIVPGLEETLEIDHSELGAFVFLHVDAVTSERGFSGYRSDISDTLDGYGGVALIDTASSALLEGDTTYGWFQMVGFPSEADLQAWYEDEDTEDAWEDLEDSTTGLSIVATPLFDPSGLPTE